MSRYIFCGGSVLDIRQGELVEGLEVLVEGTQIKEVSNLPIQVRDATRVELGGRTLMPGLIDAHVHIFISEFNIARLAEIPLTLLAFQAARLMEGMLMRGFTTVRDVAGADWGFKKAVEDGLVPGPRLFIAGRALSQTGGHGDFRRRTDGDMACACCSALQNIGRAVDGVTEVIKAAREELRLGADHLKLMVSGGVASPHDPLESTQLRLDEIGAAVEEAAHFGKYVAAHAYTSQAIQRAVSAGVRTIEHGNLLDETTASMMSAHGAYLVPTLVTYDSMARHGQELGMSTANREKNDIVRQVGLRSLELARRAGVKIGFGSDLLGPLNVDQSREFLIRAEVEQPLDILRSATLVNAEIVGRAGQPGQEVLGVLGEIVPGACADLLVVDGNPLTDLGVLQEQGRDIRLIMKDGKIVKKELNI